MVDRLKRLCELFEGIYHEVFRCTSVSDTRPIPAIQLGLGPQELDSRLDCGMMAFATPSRLPDRRGSRPPPLQPSRRACPCHCRYANQRSLQWLRPRVLQRLPRCHRNHRRAVPGTRAVFVRVRVRGACGACRTFYRGASRDGRALVPSMVGPPRRWRKALPTAIQRAQFRRRPSVLTAGVSNLQLRSSSGPLFVASVLFPVAVLGNTLQFLERQNEALVTEIGIHFAFESKLAL